MSALVHCKGNTCRSPYALLHPGQNVMSFTQVGSAVSTCAKMHSMCKHTYDGAAKS